MSVTKTQPQGIGFYNIKSGETHYAVLEPQIQAFINSSDLGINASRGQDFGWRLHEDWVRKVRAFRRNEDKMIRITDKNGGAAPTTTQVLYAIYGEELRAAKEFATENENPFEQEYLAKINNRPAVEDFDEEGADDGDSSTSTDSTPSATEPMQEVNAASDSDKPTDSKAKPATAKSK